MSMKGIDISHWQDGIDLAGVPCDFVIVKATQGTSFVDDCCDKFYQEAKKLGKKLGVYHFADGKSTGKQEADHFIKNIQGYIGEAILVLDWEADALKKGAGYAKAFLDRVYEVTGVKPLIYMSKSVCRAYDWTEVVKGDYGLWLAQYANREITGYQEKPWTDNKGMGAFKSVAIHQYTSSGRIGNYKENLDLDIAYMDEKAWDKYAKASKKVAENNGVTYYPKYTGHTVSIVTALQSMRIDSNYNYRKTIAKVNGIVDYSGTPEQNTKMLDLLKAGKLVKP